MVTVPAGPDESVQASARLAAMRRLLSARIMLPRFLILVITVPSLAAVVAYGACDHAGHTLLESEVSRVIPEPSAFMV